jgi:hypothetical protein
VFCSQTGGPLDPVRYAETLRLALKRAKIDKPMRPFHDGRRATSTWPARRSGPGFSAWGEAMELASQRGGFEIDLRAAFRARDRELVDV